MRGPIYVTNVEKMPSEPHFAVFVNESFRYDDGYGEHGQTSYSTHESLQYIAFLDMEELKDWVLRQDSRSPSFRVVRIAPCVVTKQVSIGID